MKEILRYAPLVETRNSWVCTENWQFLREEWALYGVGVAVILLRFATRIKTVGFRGFQGDDFFSLLVLAVFTMDAATVHIICTF